MRRLLGTFRKRVIAVIIVSFLIAIMAELFFPTGFRFSYLNETQFPEPKTVSYTLSDFTPDGVEISGQQITTTSTDGYLVKNVPLDMQTSQINIVLSEPISHKSRFVVFYTSVAGDSFSEAQSVQHYAFPGDQIITIDMDDKVLQDIRIDLSDEKDQVFVVDMISFEYIKPLQRCFESFSIWRLLLFWAILALIPIELLFINKP